MYLVHNLRCKEEVSDVIMHLCLASTNASWQMTINHKQHFHLASTETNHFFSFCSTLENIQQMYNKYQSVQSIHVLNSSRGKMKKY